MNFLFSVTPAKAGAHLVGLPRAKQLWTLMRVREMGPRFRGGDDLEVVRC